MKSDTTATTENVVGVAKSRLVSRYLRGSHDCRESALERMISDLWRNHPEWPSTFGPCSEGCGGSGRGSGPCADCVERAIGMLIGEPMAACGLHVAIHKTRKEARKLRDKISRLTSKPMQPRPSSSPSLESLSRLHEATCCVVADGVPCRGDAEIQELRVARGSEEKTRKALENAIAKMEWVTRRYDLGAYCDGVMDDLLDDAIERLEWSWFTRRAGHIIECIDEVKEWDSDDDDEDDKPGPEEGAWSALTILAGAMHNHAHALKILHYAEREALHHPLNDKSQQPPDSGTKK